MKVTLTELEQAARALGVKVTFEDLRTSKGGACRVMETNRIIINKHLHANEKIAVLARELGRFDLAPLDLADHVRKKIQRETDHSAEAQKLSA
jgi:IrrE N-terminal-like domain